MTPTNVVAMLNAALNNAAVAPTAQVTLSDTTTSGVAKTDALATAALWGTSNTFLTQTYSYRYDCSGAAAVDTMMFVLFVFLTSMQSWRHEHVVCVARRLGASLRSNVLRALPPDRLLSRSRLLA